MTQTGLLVFARCAGFAFRAPALSHPSVPAPVRAGFAAVLAYALTPGTHAARSFEPPLFVLALVVETALGATIGIAASLLYDAAYAGGRTLDDYVGIRASVPTAGVLPSSAFGRLWSLTFTAGFLLLDGYHIVILIFAKGLSRVPPGSVLALQGFEQFALRYPYLLVSAALEIAGPAIALAFLTQIALGVIARIVPRFATFTLSFPLVFAMALAATLAALPVVHDSAGQPILDLPFLSASAQRVR